MFILPLSHGGNTGSNPVGDANKIRALLRFSDSLVQRLANV
jgi:hypothetical protein